MIAIANQISASCPVRHGLLDERLRVASRSVIAEQPNSDIEPLRGL
jgi:hypothetical protein